jgi:SnoaL-like protein
VSAARLKEMFEQMVIAKDGDAIARYYHPDFVMYSDGMTQTFTEFEASHRGVYASPISYTIEYDEEAWVEAADRVAARAFITTSRPDETPTRIEVVLIATFVDGLIHRVWETTWPSWRQVAALEDY